MVFLLVHPFDRGFYCTDESIKFPYSPDTVPLWVNKMLMLKLSKINEFIMRIESNQSKGGGTIWRSLGRVLRDRVGGVHSAAVLRQPS